MDCGEWTDFESWQDKGNADEKTARYVNNIILEKMPSIEIDGVPIEFSNSGEYFGLTQTVYLGINK